MHGKIEERRRRQRYGDAKGNFGEDPAPVWDLVTARGLLAKIGGRSEASEAVMSTCIQEAVLGTLTWIGNFSVFSQQAIS